MVTRQKARSAYLQQRYNAAERGIEFKLTFDEWLTWWGADLDNRGRKAWNLQMQRFHDKGAYELGNIRKGTPERNSKTFSMRLLTMRADKAREDLEYSRDVSPSGPSYDYFLDEDERELRKMFGVKVRTSWK